MFVESPYIMRQKVYLATKLLTLSYGAKQKYELYVLFLQA